MLYIDYLLNNQNAPLRTYVTKYYSMIYYIYIYLRIDLHGKQEIKLVTV